MKIKKCEHYWSYIHAVYEGKKGNFFIKRYCHKCKLSQVGEVRKWRREKKYEFDIVACKAV